MIHIFSLLRRIPVYFLLLLLVSCATVPITGRSRLDLVSDDVLLSTSKQQYQQFLASHTVLSGGSGKGEVKAVGQRIAAAVEKYLRDNGQAREADTYQWEFNLIDSDEVNAWAMPGGKVVVYKGILPITQNATGLAVVMGHEIAHVVAHHGNERMSQQLVAQLGGEALTSLLSSQPAETQSLWMEVYGVGANLGVMLPYSRLQESEADRLGMIFMAMAGYDPHAAVDLWQRMANLKDRPGVPEFLSTHPADQTRIRDIQAFMDTAMQYYNP